MRPPVHRPLRLLVATGLVAVLTSCSDAGADAPEPTGPASGPSTGSTGSRGTYVALGDSYTAAPMVGSTDLAGGCFRGDGSYPALVADALDLDLVDVSCGGATSDAITSDQETLAGSIVPPQLDAVRASTDLVTISLGGNDFDLFSDLIRACGSEAARDDGAVSCSAAVLTDDVADSRRTAAHIRERLVEGIRAVQERAPDARVVVVGYPQVVPARGSCAALPVSPADASLARRVNVLLARQLEVAAEKTGVEHVDVFAATAGHDLCSADPWIADGSVRPPVGAPYHPLAAEQQAVADLLVDLLDD
ncbi:SGNH/GDSL hydrolase family protein [Nocardioides stalactiti]|uniref:SGNH/GDSL hydrolase family protein n=1 Tax=Nocardioides stalactiti TaxID=2755356 RepID=UPI0015FFB553|nr:SGNH/GDSL hydrolase family protein [Nocardioides stalactiti]